MKKYNKNALATLADAGYEIEESRKLRKYYSSATAVFWVQL